MLKEKKSFLDKLIPFSILVYSFFLSRRGGDTKDIISILIMTFIFIYSYKNKIKRYLYYKKEIFISIAYLFQFFNYFFPKKIFFHNEESYQ